MKNLFSYSKSWPWLWLFDLLTVAVLAVLLFKSTWGKNDVFPFNAAFFMGIYGFVRLIWLIVLLPFYLIKKQWKICVIVLLHGFAWFVAFYGCMFMVMGFGASVGGH